MKTIAEVSKDTLAIEEYLRSLGPDDTATYLEIAQATQVKMDTKGKSRLRVAAKRASIVYTTIRGIGIQLAGPMTGRNIVVDRTARIDRTVRRAEKATAIIMNQHLKGMTADDKQQVELVAATFAMIRVIADQRKRELKLTSSKRPVTVTPPTLQQIGI